MIRSNCKIRSFCGRGTKDVLSVVENKQNDLYWHGCQSNDTPAYGRRARVNPGPPCPSYGSMSPLSSLPVPASMPPSGSPSRTPGLRTLRGEISPRAELEGNRTSTFRDIWRTQLGNDPPAKVTPYKLTLKPDAIPPVSYTHLTLPTKA